MTHAIVKPTGSASLPTYAPWPDNPGRVRAGVSFVGRDMSGRHWLIAPAHMLAGDDGSGICTADFSIWSREVNVLWNGMRYAIPLFRDDRPIFKFMAAHDGISDIIALPLCLHPSDGVLAGAEFIDLSARDHPNSGSGHVAYDGYPYRGGTWPYSPPSSVAGEVVCEGVATYEGLQEEVQGYSGSPVFLDDGTFWGMFIAAGSGHLVVLPAWFIWSLVNDRFDCPPPTINAAQVNAKGPQILNYLRPNAPAPKVSAFCNAVIPNLTASKITSGTFTGSFISTATLEVKHMVGGTIIDYDATYSGQQTAGGSWVLNQWYDLTNFSFASRITGSLGVVSANIPPVSDAYCIVQLECIMLAYSASSNPRLLDWWFSRSTDGGINWSQVQNSTIEMTQNSAQIIIRATDFTPAVNIRNDYKIQFRRSGSGWATNQSLQGAIISATCFKM